MRHPSNKRTNPAVIILTFFFSFYNIDPIEGQNIEGSLSLCNIGAGIGSARNGNPSSSVNGRDGNTNNNYNNYIGGFPSSPTTTQQNSQFQQQNSNNDANSNEYSNYGYNTGGFYSASDFGMRHNMYMTNIESKMNENEPTDMPTYLDIVYEEISDQCKGDPECEKVMSQTIEDALDYIIEERSTYLDNQGRRHLSEMIPGILDNLGEEVTDILQQVIDQVDHTDEIQIIQNLDQILQNQVESPFSLLNSEYEKDLIRAAISTAKGSTEYWFDVFRTENHVYRRLKDLAAIKEEEQKLEKSDRVHLFDCLMGRGRLWPKRCCEPEDNYDYDDYYRSDDRSRSRRQLRRGNDKGGIVGRIKDTFLEMATTAVSHQDTQEEELLNTPISVHLKRELKENESDDVDDSKHDSYDYALNQQINLRKHEYSSYSESGRDYRYDDDDDYRKAKNYNNNNNKYDNYDKDRRRDDDYDDDDGRHYGYGISIDFGGDSDSYSNSEDSSSSSSSDENCGIWLKRIRWLYFLIRADIVGLAAGFLGSQGCIPVSISASVSFSATYVMCY